MKILTLIRHAKSSWDDPALSDFERPLNARGQHDLPSMVERMQHRGPPPDKLIFSPALRTRLTAEPLISTFGLDAATVEVSEQTYEATADTLFRLLQQQPDQTRHLMLIGHNPGLLELPQVLCADAPERMPTAAIIQLHLMIDRWHELTPHCAELAWLDYPKLHR